MLADDTTASVVGLGYVGLVLAVHLDSAGYPTIGYDIDGEKIDRLRVGEDPTREFDDETIDGSDLTFTDDPSALRESDVVLVALPTPVDDAGTPDLANVEAACETIGQHISDDTVVVFESTVYPGATREVLQPAIERGANANGGASFTVGYSPERFVPASDAGFSDVTKLVSAENDHTLAALVELYENILSADVYPVDSIETAEASKCLENVQRDVNIGLVNEFTLACRRLDVDLDPHAVLDAARTKWNFHDYRPGIVGGHCIPVDPHYLRHKFESCGFVPDVLRSARWTNEQMVEHLSSVVLKALWRARGPETVVEVPPVPNGGSRPDGALSDPVTESSVMLLGFAYKANVSDLRNSGVAELAARLQEQGLTVEGYDPYHGPESVPDDYEFEVRSRLIVDDVDALVLMAAHDEFGSLDLEALAAGMNDDPVLVDVENEVDPQTANRVGFTYRRL